MSLDTAYFHADRAQRNAETQAERDLAKAVLELIKVVQELQAK